MRKTGFVAMRHILFIVCKCMNKMLFHLLKLVNNIEGTDTAAFSVNTLVKYMFQDFGLTTTIRPAQRRMIIIMVGLWCIFLTVPWVGLQCVIVAFLGHTNLLLKSLSWLNIINI